MRKHLLLVASLLTLSPLAIAKSIDISGNYTCKGLDPFSNTTYQGSLAVKKTNDTFQFNWDLGKSGKYKGTGFYMDGIQDVIPVTVISLNKKHDPQNPSNAELQIYNIGADGSLRGSWTFLGKDKLSPAETCIKAS